MSAAGDGPGRAFCNLWRGKLTQFIFPTCVVFSAALLATVVEWRNYSSEREKKTSWDAVTCKVLDKSITMDSSSQLFRPELDVEVSAGAPREVISNATAYVEGTGDYMYDEQGADDVLMGYNVDSFYQCWMRPADSRISMTLVADLPKTSRLVLVVVLLVVTVSSFVALLTMGLVMLLFDLRDSDSYYSDNDLVSGDMENPQPRTKERRRMTKDQIRQLLERFTIPGADSSGHLTEWYCAICLEDRGAKAASNADVSGATQTSNGPIQKVALPCGHDFDAGCLKTWLRRGHVCPLCTENLRELFDPETKQLREFIAIDEAREHVATDEADGGPKADPNEVAQDSAASQGLTEPNGEANETDDRETAGVAEPTESSENDPNTEVIRI